MARWAAYIKRHHDPDAHWLTVDAGNYVDRAGTGGGCTSKCQFVITSYRDLHYDVLNLGRQEAWMGLETLQSVLDTTKNTQFVSANLIQVKSGKPVAKPYVIKDYGDFRVAILGLLNEADFPKASSLLDSTQLRVDPYFETAKKYVPMLARKADAVIVLTELPSAAIDSLAKSFPQVDLVISTGALRNGETPTTIGKTYVVGPGSSGYAGHNVMMEFNPAWKDSIACINSTDNLTETYEEPGEWQQRLTAFGTVSVPSSPPPASAVGTRPTSISPTGTPTNVAPSPSGTGTQSPPAKPVETGHEGHTHG